MTTATTATERGWRSLVPGLPWWGTKAPAQTDKTVATNTAASNSTRGKTLQEWFTSPVTRLIWGKTDGGTTGPVASTVVTDKPGGPDTRGATNQGPGGTVSTTKQPEVTVPLMVGQPETWYDPLGLFTAARDTKFNPVRFGEETATRLTGATKAFRAGKSTVPGHYGVLEMCGSLWTIASAERTAFLETYWKGITPTQANVRLHTSLRVLRQVANDRNWRITTPTPLCFWRNRSMRVPKRSGRMIGGRRFLM